MTSQRIIATAVPGGLQVDPDAIAVSVVVAPQLSGADALGAFPDWLNWPQHCLDGGLSVTFECNGAQHQVDLDTSALRPDLWKRTFDEQTFVRSYLPDDYSDAFVSSYDNRLALGLVKATYQAAGLEFAEIGGDEISGEGPQRRRSRFAQLVGGYGRDPQRSLAVLQREQRADQPRGERLQAELRRIGRAGLGPDGLLPTGALDPDDEDGTFATNQQQLVAQWDVFSHIDHGGPVQLDRDGVLDFHQALTALGPYRILQRYFGLAFDLTLPLDFVATTSPHTPGDLQVVALDAGWSPDVPTSVPATRTAYLHTAVDDKTIFAVAPLAALGHPERPMTMGMLRLDPRWFGLIQVDVDGALHKTVQHADSLRQLPGESLPEHPEVFDPATTLSTLRSGGLSLVAGARALTMRDAFERAQRHNDDLTADEPLRDPFCAEDLTRGYRVDIWDSVTGEWHSLHRRNTTVHVGADGIEITVADEEGFVQAAVTKSAPQANGTTADDDLHLHEAMVRWSGWSLSASTVGEHLTRAADPDKAMPAPDDPDPENEAVTPFAVTSSATHVPGTLPRLRFGVGYRMRLRAVDLAGNGLGLDDPACELVSPVFSMPAHDGVLAYLRFEPVSPPAIVLRDEGGVRNGSRADRLVIRTLNSSQERDTSDADTTSAERHIAPPQVHVEQAERHGMFDRADGTLDPSPAMWQLIKERDAGAFPVLPVDLGGDPTSVPIDGAAQADLPYLPDPLARAATFRDLPGTSGTVRGRVAPGAGPEADVDYVTLDDPQPRRGTATVVEFGGRDDWRDVRPFRVVLADGARPPRWDPAAAVLTVAVPKGTTHVVPLSSCCDAADLPTLGVWTWLREYLEWVTAHRPQSEFYQRPGLRDRIAHVLQLAAEGGHGMLTPPHLLTLVHAVQQPIGRPAFTRLTAQLPGGGASAYLAGLQTQPETFPTAETELDVLSAWRRPGSTDAFLVGALQVHAASTAKVDVMATWSDPVDDLVADPTTQPFSAPVDEIGLPSLREGLLARAGEDRYTGYYDADHDLVACAPAGARLGNVAGGAVVGQDAVPRHRIGDTKHHVVSYTAVATSRYRDYFPTEPPLDCTRISEPVLVHVPASARPVAPGVRYVVPTFGWERVQTGNQVRSVRTGGGLRVYLDRPWHSSGTGELLGVTLASLSSGAIDREQWKGVITQWGADPIWASPQPLADFPQNSNFPDRVAWESRLPLEDGRAVDIAGHAITWDAERKLYFCDLTVDTASTTYAPFVRLALTRYQPHALLPAKLSRVVLADFAQLTPERACTVTADPFTPAGCA